MRSSDEADKEAKCIPAHKSACIKQQVTQDRIIAGGVQLGAIYICSLNFSGGDIARLCEIASGRLIFFTSPSDTAQVHAGERAWLGALRVNVGRVCQNLSDAHLS